MAALLNGTQFSNMVSPIRNFFRFHLGKTFGITKCKVVTQQHSDSTATLLKSSGHYLCTWGGSIPIGCWDLSCSTMVPPAHYPDFGKSSLGGLQRGNWESMIYTVNDCRLSSVMTAIIFINAGPIWLYTASLDSLRRVESVIMRRLLWPFLAISSV